MVGVELLEEALQIARKIDFRFATALMLCQIGHTKLALGKVDAARHAYAKALQITTDEQIFRITMDVRLGMAQIMLLDGDFEQGVELLEQVSKHPTSEYETKKKAENLLADLETPNSNILGFHDDLPLKGAIVTR